MAFHYIKEMRQRLGLEEDDTSRDAEIEDMTPIRRFNLLCGWYLGDIAWAQTIIDWQRDAGFTITSR